jgi:hypothetical protein
MTTSGMKTVMRHQFTQTLFCLFLAGLSCVVVSQAAVLPVVRIGIVMDGIEERNAEFERIFSRIEEEIIFHG